ncbi:MAG: DUF1273 domain-containing protein [Alistipes sp.]|nr:DUF1273 domain-containing protein [Alistipes sp.]
MIDKKRTACFTGHRKMPENDIKKVEKQLDKIIEKLYKKGVIFYGVGGSYGFDMLAERAVIRARNKHREIKLILVLPCQNQEKYWTVDNKKAFAEIKNQADKIVYTSENYFKDCMHRRNRHLVNFSGYCVAYLNENSGGTAYTVNYARQKGLEIVNLGRLSD